MDRNLEFQAPLIVVKELLASLRRLGGIPLPVRPPSVHKIGCILNLVLGVGTPNLTKLMELWLALP